MQELWTALDATIKEAILTIKNCDEATFLETHHVQAFRLSGVDVALHAVEHLSYHVGQVAFCCLLYTSPSPRDRQKSRMPSSA